MAHEMTPQERAAAIAEQIVKALDVHPSPINIDAVLPWVQQTRRAALRDVLSDLDSLHWKEHWYADQLRKKINDRLVSEGA